MHVETYPVFLTPRDKEPSLSSSEEKSSENVWLARKWKWKRRKKTEQGSVYSIYLSIYIFRWITWFPQNKLLRAIYKENYKTKYLRIFTPFPNLITKESYNWWVARRIWGFRQQKSEEKYPKVSVATIGKLQENFAGAQNGCEISQTNKMAAKLAFNLEWSASNDSNFFISTPICKLFEALDFWLPDLQNDI